MADDALRLHTDVYGIVWCGQNGVRAFRTGLPPDEFVRRSVFRDAQRIKLLGIPVNASLIVQVHEAREVKRQILLGSPTVCCKAEYLHSPEFVLQRMWQSDTTAKTQGCWHHLTNSDYTVYLLISSMKESGGNLNNKIENIIKYHPIWQAISFLPEFDLHSATKLACEIVDPRWYNNPTRPTRHKKLLRYLGVDPRNILALTGIVPPGASAACRNWRRAELVLRSWRGLDCATGFDLDEPRNFLWRIYRDHGSGANGLLKASQSFIQFVRLVWLQELANGTREVFCPEFYFRNECETAAYRKHRASRPHT